MNDEIRPHSEETERTPRYVPLLIDTDMPDVLRPTYEPHFENCVVCDCALQEEGAPLYIVERGVRGDEPIFEYAMCLSCASTVREELSAESLERLDRHFDSKFPYDERREWILGRTPVSRFLDRCAFEGTRREDCSLYQVVGLCSGTRLMLNEDSPFLLSEEALEDFFPLLSARTRDRIDGFTRDHLGLPPELCDLPILL